MWLNTWISKALSTRFALRPFGYSACLQSSTLLDLCRHHQDHTRQTKLACHMPRLGSSVCLSHFISSDGSFELHFLRQDSTGHNSPKRSTQLFRLGLSAKSAPSGIPGAEKGCGTIADSTTAQVIHLVKCPVPTLVADVVNSTGVNR